MLKTIILDLDGTVYRGNEVIKGVPEAVAGLRQNGVKIFFLSNASMRTRKQMAEKLNRMGIPCSPGEVYNTAYATALYIKQKHPDAKVYPVSEGGLQEELALLGIKMTDGQDADIVAVGLDTKITYDKLLKAFRALVVNNAEFIATNVDHMYPTDKGMLPGSGTLVAFLEYGSSRKPFLIGKPEPHLAEMILREHGLKKNEVLIVGDSLESDLGMAKKMGIKCAIVLTGIATKKEIKKLPKKGQPEFVIDSLAELLSILQ